MKVSIVTVTYNSGDTLKESIDSVFKQTYHPIEHIIVDGKSTDDTLAIINRNRDKVNYFISEEDSGIYNAMNKGLTQATGDIIGILNSDDLYMNEKIIGKIVATFEKYEVDAVYGDLQYVNKDNDRVVRYWKAGTCEKEKFERGWMPPHPSFFVKKEAYDTYGLFNEELNTAADYELMLRFLYRYGLTTYYLPEVLVRMRRGGISNVSIKNRLRAALEDYKAWELNGLDARISTQVLKRLSKLPQFVPMLFY